MNHEQTAAIMRKVKLDDNRNFGNEEEQAIYLRDWHEKIGDLDFLDAMEAVRAHTRDSTEYLKASHIRAGVKKIRARRERKARIDAQLARQALPAPRINLDRAQFELDTQASIEAHRAARAAG